MWPFADDEDHNQKQIDVCQELIEEKQAEIDALEDVDAADSAAAETRRRALSEEIQQLQINIAQIKESSERAGDELESHERDGEFFED